MIKSILYVKKNPPHLYEGNNCVYYNLNSNRSFMTCNLSSGTLC